MSGERSLSSWLAKEMEKIRCSWRRMAQRIAKRPKIIVGTSQFPRTRTSRVPVLIVSAFSYCLPMMTQLRLKTNNHTISGLIEAVIWVTMACENDHLVSSLLQSHSRINNQPLGATDPQVGVQKDYCPLLFGLFTATCRHGEVRCWSCQEHSFEQG